MDSLPFRIIFRRFKSWFICLFGGSPISGSLFPLLDQWVKQEEKLDQPIANNRLRVMSYNMLYDDLDSELPFLYRWPQRLPRLVTYINAVQPDLLATQELLPHQLQQLEQQLGEHYDVCVDRTIKGETNAIFYRKERIELLTYQTIILDPLSPQRIGYISLSAQFKEKQHGQLFTHFNTHFSFHSAKVRLNQAQALLAFIKAEECKEGPKQRLIVTGDLNTFPHYVEQPLPFEDGEKILEELKNNGLRRSDQIALWGHIGSTGSFSNRPGCSAPFEGFGTPGVLLDHILVTRYGITVLTHLVDPVLVDGLHPSDHLPVIVDLQLHEAQD